MKHLSEPASASTSPKDRLTALATQIAEKCKACKLCQKECFFIKEYGLPDEIARGVLDGSVSPSLGLECSLCSMCTQVCPVKGLDPKAMFQAMREVAVAEDPDLLKPFSPLLRYERVGRSDAMSLFAVPEGGTRAFFTGCTLPGIRPETTWNTWRKLCEDDPKTGVVMHCCSVPSRQCGLADRHEENMSELVGRLADAGVTEVLTACPNCTVALRESGGPFAVRTVYEVLAEVIPEPAQSPETRRSVAVHDPCVLRFDPQVHQAVRTLLWNTGGSVSEMRHAHHKAMCCGEGGGVGFVRPDLVEKWQQARVAEAKDRELAVYCGGCLNGLAPHTPTVHLLDMVLGAKSEKPAKSAMSYVNRVRLKHRIRARIKKES